MYVLRNIFLVSARNSRVYSDSNVYMSLFIMSLFINVYMWIFQMNKNDVSKSVVRCHLRLSIVAQLLTSNNYWNILIHFSFTNISYVFFHFRYKMNYIEGVILKYEGSK